MRPTSGPPNGGKRRGNNFDRHKRKPPRGMYINHDDIVSLAGPENNDEANQNRNHLLASMDREISSLLSQVRVKFGFFFMFFIDYCILYIYVILRWCNLFSCFFFFFVCVNVAYCLTGYPKSNDRTIKAIYNKLL